MNLRDLNYFHQLVRDRNFTKVAVHFNVSQPTITFAIKRLEKEFDTKLVERNHTHSELRITSSGMQLNQHVDRMLNDWHLAHQEIRALNRQMIRFGMSPTISNYFFPGVTDRLIQTGLLNHLYTYEDGSREVLRLILEGQVDIGLIGRVRPLLNDQLASESLKVMHFRLVVGPSSPLAKREAVSFKEASSYPFVVLGQHFANPVAFAQIAGQAGVSPHIIYRSSNIDTLKRIVSRGVAVSYIAELSILPNDPIISIPLTDENAPELTVMMVYRKSLELTESVRRFMAIIREIAL
ncbi:LysR family transcriptional regulator [Sporolactobacillus vineae]|uniref:LysR family transcriptional regulator n=1 Tax=Sporolactobacillus vineae TaxID=444463 RepID=UPI000288E88C|nr:LysR family transcriptional regulator [Sporolactobacillus vineae]